MRAVFSQAMLSKVSDPRFVFLTGDLGFNALESLKQQLGDRFINAGVAEQNMVAVAAGLASEGLRPWVYSIAPFVYARPFEQIRNDIAFHSLPVTLVGNGGGYGYGVMGATHHALEDYGVLCALPNMHCFVPAFDSDVGTMIERISRLELPSYLRLGLSELPADFSLPEYSPLRHLLVGDSATLLVVGPLAGGIASAIQNLEEARRPDLWVLTEMPFARTGLSDGFLESIRRTGNLIVAEEHVESGSVGSALASLLLQRGEPVRSFRHHFAKGYPGSRYGSQAFHRRESGIDQQSILSGISG